MRFHDLSGNIRRGNDNGGDLSELQVHDRPVLDGQISQSNMGQGTDQKVHVPYQRQLRRPRRETRGDLRLPRGSSNQL